MEDQDSPPENWSAVNKKNKASSEVRPYYYHEHIAVFYEIKYGKETINPGDLLRFKNERGTFQFIQLVHNIVKDTSWIDCMEVSTGRYRSFYVDKLKGMTRAKKSIRKKINV